MQCLCCKRVRFMFSNIFICRRPHVTVGAEIGTFIWSVLCTHPSPIPPFLAIFNTHKVDNHDDCNSFLEKRLDLVSLFSCDITSSISWSFCCNALSYSASCWQLCQICCTRSFSALRDSYICSFQLIIAPPTGHGFHFICVLSFSGMFHLHLF